MWHCPTTRRCAAYLCGKHRSVEDWTGKPLMGEQKDFQILMVCNSLMGRFIRRFTLSGLDLLTTCSHVDPRPIKTPINRWLTHWIFPKKSGHLTPRDTDAASPKVWLKHENRVDAGPSCYRWMACHWVVVGDDHETAIEQRNLSTTQTLACQRQTDRFFSRTKSRAAVCTS